MLLAKKRNESIVRDMKREFPSIGMIYWDWLEEEKAKYRAAGGDPDPQRGLVEGRGEGEWGRSCWCGVEDFNLTR